MRAFITGVGGFAGSRLSDYLLNHTDWQVIGCVLPGWDCSLLDQRVDILVSYSRIAVCLEPDRARMRPSDTSEMRCDPSKIRNLLGWEPIIPLEQTLRDVLDEWRATVDRNEKSVDQ